MGEVRLWKLPYETALSETHLNTDEIRQRMLLILPFQAGDSGGLGKARLLHFKGVLSGDDGATHYYQDARPSNVEISAAKLTPLDQEIYFRAKQNASYWLGLVSFERGKYAEAIDYFATRTLRAWPDGPWTPGANYNLGRAYEANGQSGRAIAQYRQENTPADDGELLRAAWLEKHPGGVSVAKSNDGIRADHGDTVAGGVSQRAALQSRGGKCRARPVPTHPASSSWHSTADR